MNPAEFRAPSAGKAVQAPGGYAAFVLAPLPPALAYDRRHRGRPIAGAEQ